VLETRPPKLTRENFVGEPLMVILYGKKLEPLVGCRSEKTGRRLHVSWTLFVWGAGRRHFCTPPAAAFFFRTAFGVSVGTSSLSCSATLETL